MFLQIRIKGTFDFSFYARESSASSGKEDDGIMENSQFFTGVERLKSQSWIKPVLHFKICINEMY